MLLEMLKIMRCKAFKSELKSRGLSFVIIFAVFLTMLSVVFLNLDLLAAEESINHVEDYLSSNYISAGNIDEALSALFSTSVTREQTNAEKLTFKGLLYSDETSSKEIKERLLHAINILEGKINSATGRYLYVVSRDGGFVYFFNKQEYASISPESLPLILKSFHLILNKNKKDSISNDMINNIIGWGTQNQKNNVTDFYCDRGHHGMAISVFYPVYNFRDMSIVGYVFMDDFMSNLTDVVNKRIQQPKPWIGLSLVNDISGESTCFYGHCGHSVLEKKSQVSDGCHLLMNVDFKSFILKSKGFLFSLIISLSLSLGWLIIVSIRAANSKIMNMNDSLSGLKNREILKKITPGKDSAIIVFDCDKFKEINDNYGHNTGDMAIVRIADTIKGNIRSGDVAVRYGGDEFLVYLGSQGSYAEKVAGRIADEINSSPLVIEDNVIYMSVSFGYAKVEGNISKAISEADKYMFINKKLRSLSQS